MAGYEEYQELLLKYAQGKIDALVASHGKELSQVMVNHLFRVEGPTRLTPPPSDPEADTFRIVFYGFTEVAWCGHPRGVRRHRVASDR